MSHTALTGSCHCGHTKYIVFLDLPHTNPDPQRGEQRFQRCNCTSCHKMGHFHVKPSSPSDDFLLLSPLQPETQLSNYTCFDHVLNFYFCPTCGVRCLIFAGKGEQVDLDLGELGVPGYEKGSLTKVWRATRDGGHPEFGTYLSVNGTTVDAKQGLDLRVLTEEKRVKYLDCLESMDKEDVDRYDRPHEGGCF